MSDSCAQCKKPLYFGAKAYDKEREFCTVDCHQKYMKMPEALKQNIAESALNKAKNDIKRLISDLQSTLEVL